MSAPYATYRVVRYFRATRAADAILATDVTLTEAGAIAARLRLADAEREAVVGYRVETAPLTEQADAMGFALPTPAPVSPVAEPVPAVAEEAHFEGIADAPAGRANAGPLRRTLANVARRVAMQAAHARARAIVSLCPATPYAVALGSALRSPAPRRCTLANLRRQALAWARVALATGARFNVAQKAADALAFSASANLRSLAVPSKLTGTASYQDAAEAVAERMQARGGWTLCEHGTGAADDALGVYALGLRLGAVQPKHAGWITALPSARVAVTAVTGGEAFVGADGRERVKTRGVNVAVEVGQAALAFVAGGGALAGEAVPSAAVETEAKLAAWF